MGRGEGEEGGGEQERDAVGAAKKGPAQQSDAQELAELNKVKRLRETEAKGRAGQGKAQEGDEGKKDKDLRREMGSSSPLRAAQRGPQEGEGDEAGKEEDDGEGEGGRASEQ